MLLRYTILTTTIITCVLSLTIFFSQNIPLFDTDTPLLVGATLADEGVVISLHDPQSGHRVNIGTVHTTVEGRLGLGIDVTWSPNDEFITMLGYDTKGEKRILQLFDLNTGDTRLLSDALTLDICTDASAWSTDGRYLAYVEGEIGGEHQLYILDSATNTIRHITTIESTWFGASWSSSGGTLRWVDQTVEIRIISAEGTEFQTWSATGELMDRYDYERPQYYDSSLIRMSPNHRYLLLKSGDTDIVIFDLKQWQRIQFTLPTNRIGLQWAATGDLIISWSNDKLAVFDLETQILYSLTPDDVRIGGSGYAWQASGNYLFAQRWLPDEERSQLSVWDMTTDTWAFLDENNIRSVLGWWADAQYLAYNMAYENQEDIAGLYVLDTTTWQSTRLISYMRGVHKY